MIAYPVGLTAAALIALSSSSAPAQDNKETFLFAEVAASATTSDGVLTLSGVDDTIAWFSDRPFRDAGLAPLADVVAAWTKDAASFAEDPPNAALTGIATQGSVSLVVELSNPRLQEDDLVFDYSLIGGREHDRLDNVSLFIDSPGDCPIYSQDRCIVMP